MTSSKYRAVRSMMSRCPLVTGSNEPGMRAIAKGDSLLSAGGPSHRDNRTAVALLSENFPTATEVQLPGGFDDHEASERLRQQVHPPVEVVRRVGERYVVVARSGHEAEHVAAHGRPARQSGAGQIGLDGVDGRSTGVDERRRRRPPRQRLDAERPTAGEQV